MQSAEIGNKRRHFRNDLIHSRHAETSVPFADHKQRRNRDLQASGETLQFPVPIEVSVVVQTASEA